MITDIDWKSLVVSGRCEDASWRLRQTLKRRVQELLQLTLQLTMKRCLC